MCIRDRQVATALSPGEQVIKIVRDELVETLGRDTARLKFASQPPTVVLMAGLQGSGKTTTSGKLAHWLKNGGHRPLLVSVDVYRPAAREQLKVVAQAIKANLYEGEVGEANTATVERLAKEARREAINTGSDVLIVDTAGRLHIDDQLMEMCIRDRRDGVAESDSPQGGSHRNWSPLARLVNNSSRLPLFLAGKNLPAGKNSFASRFGP